MKTNGHTQQQSGIHRGLRPCERAVEFAAGLIPKEMADETAIRLALSELCLDSRFRLQRINIEGLSRAEGVLTTYWRNGCSRELMLERCYRMLAELASNEPLDATPKLAKLASKQKLRPYLMCAVGALDLALQCSDHFDRLVLTAKEYTEWSKKLDQERNGVDTPRYT